MMLTLMLDGCSIGLSRTLTTLNRETGPGGQRSDRGVMNSVIEIGCILLLIAFAVLGMVFARRVDQVSLTFAGITP